MKGYPGSSRMKPVFNIVGLLKFVNQSADNSPVEAKLMSSSTFGDPSIVHPNNLAFFGFTKSYTGRGNPVHLNNYGTI